MNWQFVHELGIVGTPWKGKSFVVVCSVLLLLFVLADAKTRCRASSPRRWVTCNVSCTGSVTALPCAIVKWLWRDNISKCCFILSRCAKNCVFANSTLCSFQSSPCSSPTPFHLWKLASPIWGYCCLPNRQMHVAYQTGSRAAYVRSSGERTEIRNVNYCHSILPAIGGVLLSVKCKWETRSSR